MALPAFAGYAGSRKPKMLVVAEAWGENEQKLRQPLVGYSGKEFFLMLGEAMPDLAPELHAQITSQFKYDLAWVRTRHEWFEAAGIGLTNVFNLRPIANKIEYLCAKRTEVGPRAAALPALERGLYLRDEYLPELDRLWQEIEACQPNLILACGNTACWAVLRATNIGSIRGATAESITSPNGLVFKVLPTYHPAGVMRQWSWRPIAVADIMKAGREMEFPEIRRPKRRVLINPTLEEVLEWTARWRASPPAEIAADIETGAGMIKCISFADSPRESITIPFVDLTLPGGSYWPTLEQELQVWNCVKDILEGPSVKIGQNFIYDLQYITRMGIMPRQCTEDTMLLHHALYPEMLKGLGFLGSVYTEEASWKLMRRPKADTEKRDE
jgi:uracil-DNA glycosylase